MMDDPYFAYGSNMNLAQMASRCPGAKLGEQVRLSDWRYFINGNGYAGIEEFSGGLVHGCLWSLLPQHWEALDQYEGVARNHDEAQYFANVTNLDAAVGKLLKTLKLMKLDQNTLVIFTSDNGPETLLRYGPRSGRSFGVADPLRGMKLWTTEAGFRVAGIMHWPARIKPGQVSGQTVSALDFLPTFCDLADTKIPKNLKLDGTSFLPALAGRGVKRDKPLLWVYYSALNERRVAMRDGKWKVLARMNFPKTKTINQKNELTAKGAQLSDFQIFDLSQDIDESNNLAQSNPSKLKELQKTMKIHYRELVNDSHAWK